MQGSLFIIFSNCGASSNLEKKNKNGDSVPGAVEVLARRRGGRRLSCCAQSRFLAGLCHWARGEDCQGYH